MSYQELFNILLAVVGVLLGWAFQVTRATISDLQTQVRNLRDQAKTQELVVVRQFATKDDVDKAFQRILEKVERIEALEVLLAGHYVRKDDFTKTIDALFAKLDKIEDKVDQKSDKQRN